MDPVQLFHYEDREVRTILINEEPWWVVKDVLDILNLAHTTNSVKGLDDQDLTVIKLQSGGQQREMYIVNEPGLYTLILRSNKPEARNFKRWITHEVIPQIRRTGTYQIDKVSRKQLALMVLKAEEDKERLLEIIDRNKPKLVAYDTFLDGKGNKCISQVAKELYELTGLGPNRFFQILRDRKILFYSGPRNRQVNLPMQKYIEQGLFRVKNSSKGTDSEGNPLNFSTTLVTPKGQVWLTKILSDAV